MRIRMSLPHQGAFRIPIPTQGKRPPLCRVANTPIMPLALILPQVQC